MSDTVISSELVRPREEVFSDPETLALAGGCADRGDAHDGWAYLVV